MQKSLCKLNSEANNSHTAQKIRWETELPDSSEECNLRWYLLEECIGPKFTNTKLLKVKSQCEGQCIGQLRAQRKQA